ncbi:hypothetical protein NIIDNTM18_42850 [Mycolicibacterium litorale]|uniref:Uncharacterized protein n=1 Tax=Mycolicibacterium litorale TaxID=758802 RepID=A0A6S6PBK8_9MYCO|nr:hypothetical protein [Mycolicibacterium litorale]BCI55007.1 hypothetical protein NIIDNTM18_42850 [Mycolicibacterium litorale]
MTAQTHSLAEVYVDRASGSYVAYCLCDWRSRWCETSDDAREEVEEHVKQIATARAYSGPNDPFTFASEVEKAYRLYQKQLLTAKEFADVTGESLRKRMNYSEVAS